MTREAKVGLLCTMAASAALVLPFFSLQANRVAQPRHVWLFEALPGWMTLGVLLPLGAAWAAVLAVRGRWQGRVLWGASAAGVAGALAVLGAAGLVQGQMLPPAGRLGLGAGWVLYTLAMAVPWFGLEQGRVRTLLGAAGILGVAAVAALGGGFDSLGIVKEAGNQRSRLILEVGNHLRITGAAVFLAGLGGIPGAFWAYRRQAARKVLFTATNLLQTIPTIALFGLLIAPLTSLGQVLPWLRQAGLRGIGDTPAIIALALYALFPVLRNSYEGLAGVDARVLDASRGMGMSRFQVTWLVLLPAASPVILHGLRVALVQTLGNAVLAKLVGAGGLGVFVFEGLGQYSVDMVLLGILLVGGITLVVDGLMRGIMAVLTPRALASGFAKEVAG
ncbi:ABC transporter permease [Spirochaeta lutea]|uniref:ABC transporter permease n=1 Tax=Spirochaeta lutea TaxID=1480694 RepID=UPI0012DFEFDE|nr:ABC transporter permease [Spirochaeta lutea]